MPLKTIVAGDPGALLLIAMLPLTAPAEAGANCAVMETLEEGFIVCGIASPVMPNPVPVTVA